MQYTYEDFEACLEQPFLLQQDNLSGELQLIRVERMEKTQTPDGREAFAIILRSASQDVLPQQIYHLSNETLGDLQLFIVPVGQDETGVKYEAIFS